MTAGSTAAVGEIAAAVSQQLACGVYGANPHVDTLTADDLQFLEEDGVSNDEINNFHMGLYQLEAMRFAVGSLQTLVFLNTFFYAKLAV